LKIINASLLATRKTRPMKALVKIKATLCKVSTLAWVMDKQRDGIARDAAAGTFGEDSWGVAILRHAWVDD